MRDRQTNHERLIMNKDRVYIQEKPVFTDVFCPSVGVETARDGFCVSCGSTTHETL